MSSPIRRGLIRNLSAFFRSVQRKKLRGCAGCKIELVESSLIRSAKYVISFSPGWGSFKTLSCIRLCACCTLFENSLLIRFTLPAPGRDQIHMLPNAIVLGDLRHLVKRI